MIDLNIFLKTVNFFLKTIIKKQDYFSFKIFQDHITLLDKCHFEI